MAKQYIDNITNAQEYAMLAKHATPRPLYRIAFEITRNGIPIYFHPFSINPEDMNREDQAQVTITPTLGGAYVDDFGLGIMTYNIKGTTGFRDRRNAEGQIVNGYTEMKSLRDNVYRYFLEPGGNRKERLNDTYGLIYHDWAMEEHFIVQPSGRFILARSKSKPTLYAYDFTFVVISPTTISANKYGAYKDVLIRDTRERLGAAHGTLVAASDLLRILTAFVPRR